MKELHASQQLLFPLGQVVATPQALDVLAQHQIIPEALLARHQNGDWGVLPEEDAAANQAALADGGRLLSSYSLAEGITMWIITESDRSATTLLLPSEY
jgi:hypothetical protein